MDVRLALRSFRIKRRGWESAVEVDFTEGPCRILTGLNAGGKTLTLNALHQFCKILNSPSSAKQRHFERFAENAEIERLTVHFGYQFFKWFKKEPWSNKNILPWFDLDFDGFDWTTYDERLGMAEPGQRDYLQLGVYGHDILPDSIEGHVIICRDFIQSGMVPPESMWKGSESMLFEVSEEWPRGSNHSFQHVLQGAVQVFESTMDTEVSRSFGPKFAQEDVLDHKAWKEEWKNLDVRNKIKQINSWTLKLKEDTGLNFNYNINYGEEHVFEDPTNHYNFEVLVPEMLSIGQAYTIDDQQIKDLRERSDWAKNTGIINRILSEQYRLRQEILQLTDPEKDIWATKDIDTMVRIISDSILADYPDLVEHLRSFPNLEKSMEEIATEIIRHSIRPSVDYDSMTLPVLKGLLKDRKLESSGRKKELVSRLVDNDEELSDKQEKNLKEKLKIQEDGINNYRNYQILAIASCTVFPEFFVKEGSDGKWDFNPEEIIDFKYALLPKLANFYANVQLWGVGLLSADPRNEDFADFSSKGATRTKNTPIKGQPIVKYWTSLFTQTIPKIKEIGDLNITQRDIVREHFSDFHFYDSMSRYGHLLSKEHWSSGEKRILSMFSRISEFHDIPKSTILVDEPELSLHIDWQTTLVTDISTALNEHNLLFATHSPSLIEDHISKVVLVPPQEVDE